MPGSELLNRKDLNNNATILVVDDDARIRELLRSTFESELFTVLEASSSEELYERLETCEVNLITMDVMLDKENGLDLIRDIRKMSQVPIIIITGRVDLIDTVVGLELGADDYITKPFLVRELIARVRSVLRRARTSRNQATAGGQGSPVTSQTAEEKEIIRFGNWTLNRAARELTNSDIGSVSLTATEYELLDIFLSSAHRVLSREFLVERLTGKEWYPSDRAIDNHVAQLRKKIEVGDEIEWIKTVRGAGYMFVGKVLDGADTPE